MHILRSRRAFLAAALSGFTCLLTLTGCGGGKQVIYDGGATGYIKGQVTRGPLSPVAQAGQTDTAPLPGVVVTVLTAGGKEQARQITDSQGNYNIPVPPGTYKVQGLAPSGSQGLSTPPAVQTVTVSTYQIVIVNLAYDTGIR